jgi:hypothetical protein
MFGVGNSIFFLASFFCFLSFQLKDMYSLSCFLVAAIGCAQEGYIEERNN